MQFPKKFVWFLIVVAIALLGVSITCNAATCDWWDIERGKAEWFGVISAFALLGAIACVTASVFRVASYLYD